MRPGAAAGPVNMPFGVMVTYPGYLAAVFIHDNQIISALIARASADRQLAALRARAAFEAAARAIPALAAWTDPAQARPITNLHTCAVPRSRVRARPAALAFALMLDYRLNDRRHRHARHAANPTK